MVVIPATIGITGVIGQSPQRFSPGEELQCEIQVHELHKTALSSDV